MNAGGSKGRYLQEEYDKALEQDLRELSDSSLATSGTSNPNQSASQQQNNRKLLKRGKDSSAMPENFREDPVTFWAWQLEHAFLKLDKTASHAIKGKGVSVEARNDLLQLFQEVQLLDIQNLEEQSFKILLVLTGLRKNIEKLFKDKNEEGHEIFSHRDSLIQSVNDRLQAVKDRQTEMNELKDQCKLLTMMPLGSALLKNVQDTATVILGHLSEQSDYLSKEEKAEIRKYVVAVTARAERILSGNYSGLDLSEEIKALDEHLKEETQQVVKNSMNELYHKTRKNVGSRLRKALNLAQFEELHKEVEGQIEECLRATICEFSAMNNKFYNKRDSLITKLSPNEFRNLAKDFSRNWSKWVKPHKKAPAEVQLSPSAAVKVHKLNAFYSDAGSKIKRHSVSSTTSEPRMPPIKSGGWMGKGELKFRKK